MRGRNGYDYYTNNGSNQLKLNHQSASQEKKKEKEKLDARGRMSLGSSNELPTRINVRSRALTILGRPFPCFSQKRLISSTTRTGKKCSITSIFALPEKLWDRQIGAEVLL